jgi:hypothetical protein
MPELKNEFTWSKSRGDVFRLCRRKYYYQYYGSWGGWEPLAPPEARRAYVLKQLKNRFLWAGEVVHHDVAHALRRLSLGEFVTLEQSLTRARTRMRRQFLDSRARLYWQKPKEIAGFCEHEYNLPVTREQWKGTWRHVETCLRNFYADALFQKLQKLGPWAWKTIEHRLSFPLGDIPVFVKIDLAFEEDGFLTIVDWKTGKSDDSEAGLFPLACCALFAQEEWDYPPERMRIVESNLYTGRDAARVINGEKLEEIAERIRNESRLMKAALAGPLDNRADIADFSLTENKVLCRGCNFQRLCYPQGLDLMMTEQGAHAVGLRGNG